MSEYEVDPLAPEALENLRYYKYSSVDKSPISNYILRHYWNAAVQLLPMWLAPNLVTLLGFFCILINIVFVVVFIPDLTGPASPWLYFSFALGVWMYSTMDNIDGKQARRTGSSSPLGELFDHGIDSLNCTLASLLETAAMGFGPTRIGAFTAMVPCLPMFFSTWETYHTHTLYLGYFNGPTEGLIIASSIMILSGIYGPEIWKTPAAQVFGFESIFGDRTIRSLWIPMLLLAFTFVHLPGCVINVLEARKREGLPLLDPFYEWTPMIIFTASCCAWLGSPHSTLLEENHLVLFCLTMSLVFGRLTTKIILHHLTRQPFPYFTILLVPLMGGAIIANMPLLGLPGLEPATEKWYLQGYFVFALVVYSNWAWRVIDAICRFLDINCLTIKQKRIEHKEVQKFEQEMVDGNGSLRETIKLH